MIELRALDPDTRRLLLSQAGRDGADLRRAQRTAAAESDRALAVRLARERIARGLPIVEKGWSTSIMAFHVRMAWPVAARDTVPAPPTIERHLSDAVRLGELPPPAAWPLNGLPQSP